MLFKSPTKVCGSTIFTVDKLLLPPVGNLLTMIAGNPNYSRYKINHMKLQNEQTPGSWT